MPADGDADEIEQKVECFLRGGKRGGCIHDECFLEPVGVQQAYFGNLRGIFNDFCQVWKGNLSVKCDRIDRKKLGLLQEPDFLRLFCAMVQKIVDLAIVKFRAIRPQKSIYEPYR